MRCGRGFAGLQSARRSSRGRWGATSQVLDFPSKLTEFLALTDEVAIDLLPEPVQALVNPINSVSHLTVHAETSPGCAF